MQRGADGDAGVEIAVEGKIADAAGIRPARGLFEFGNDLHGADFRRAADGARRKRRAHQIVRRLVGGKFALDLRHDVHDVAVTLDDHQVLHLHAAEIADAPDVVARQVHEHDVLGAFLRVGEQFLFQRGVLLRRSCRDGACRRWGEFPPCRPRSAREFPATRRRAKSRPAPAKTCRATD